MKLKNKLRTTWQSVAGFFSMIGLFFRNLWLAFIWPATKPRVFEGWLHFWCSKIYADRRTRISRVNKYCGGKFHYVIPAGDISLVVLSSNEIRDLKARRVLKSNLNISTLLKEAYYVSTDKNKNIKKH